MIICQMSNNNKRIATIFDYGKIFKLCFAVWKLKPTAN